LADATEARTLIRQLNHDYDRLGRAFRVEEVAGGYQLMTRAKFAAWLRRLDDVPKEMRLSAPALETLAVIAYRQPSGRAEIEAIRGVNCGEILRQLMDRNLIRIAGRGDELGRPYLYSTTRRFLQLFGLRTLDELPRAAQLAKSQQAPATTNPSQRSYPDSTERSEEEPQVTATIRSELAPEELKKIRAGNQSVISTRASDEADEENLEGEEEEVDDDDDDDDDFEDEDFDDVDDDDLDDEEDFEDDEWEEVEDDEDEDDDEDWEEDDEDWEEDEGDDDDGDEEGEEEEDEEEDWD
jgi:segregation and condensation protein B